MKKKYTYDAVGLEKSEPTASVRSNIADAAPERHGNEHPENFATAPQAVFGRGVRLGLDVGQARVGVASSDPDGLIATPVATEARAQAVIGVVRHIASLDARAVVIGLPRTLKGAESASAIMAREFGHQLHRFLSERGVYIPIRFIDERFTTVSAHSALSASGRKHKSHRSVVDQVAAVMILQHALDVERNTGVPAGELLVSEESS